MPTRGTPRVQFANIRKMILCQGLPHCLRLCIDPCMSRHAQSLNSSLHTWPQNLEAFLDYAETGEKRQNVISSSVQHPISLIFAIHVSFIIPLVPMMWILLTKPMQKSVTTACLHCSFATLKNTHIGVLGTNVGTISWLHWSPVLPSNVSQCTSTTDSQEHALIALYTRFYSLCLLLISWSH